MTALTALPAEAIALPAELITELAGSPTDAAIGRVVVSPVPARARTATIKVVATIPPIILTLDSAIYFGNGCSVRYYTTNA